MAFRKDLEFQIKNLKEEVKELRDELVEARVFSTYPFGWCSSERISLVDLKDQIEAIKERFGLETKKLDAVPERIMMQSVL